MKTYRGKSPRQWVANHERMMDPPECEHGHLGCSCSSAPGGPCLDEMLSTIEAAEEEAREAPEGRQAPQEATYRYPFEGNRVSYREGGRIALCRGNTTEVLQWIPPEDQEEFQRQYDEHLARGMEDFLGDPRWGPQK